MVHDSICRRSKEMSLESHKGKMGKMALLLFVIFFFGDILCITLLVL
jgi:hypothetical protein